MMTIYPENAVLLAPLAGHTDLAMRHACMRHGCRFAFTEMVDAGSLVFGGAKTLRIAERGSDEPFLGIQLVGSDPGILAKAAEIAGAGKYDVLDFNLGCPAPKVERKGEGAAFVLTKPDEAVRMTELLVKKSRIPVTVKTRILSETDPEPTVAFLKRIESAGVSAITLHGRIAKKFYSGEPVYSVIRAARESLGVPLIANGGIMDRASCVRMRAETGCSRVMIARGALGNPWLFEETGEGEYRPPSAEELAEEILRQVEEMLLFYGEEAGFRACRKTVLEYLRGRGYPGTLRSSASYLDSRESLRNLAEEVRRGPGEGYWSFLAKNPESPRRLSQ